jgi:MarR family 2-MHQ and catechol resistance regulon transcriptional repressor
MTSSPSPTELAQALHHLHLASQHLAALARARRGLDRSEYHAVTELTTRGRMSVIELGRRLGLTSGAATKLVDRLHEKGYATRQSDPNDRRRAIVNPTAEALQTAHELEQAFDQIAHESLAQLPPSQRAPLAHSLRVIAKRIDQAQDPQRRPQ